MTIAHSATLRDAAVIAKERETLPFHEVGNLGWYGRLCKRLNIGPLRFVPARRITEPSACEFGPLEIGHPVTPDRRRGKRSLAASPGWTFSSDCLDGRQCQSARYCIFRPTWGILQVADWYGQGVVLDGELSLYIKAPIGRARNLES